MSLVRLASLFSLSRSTFTGDSDRRHSVGERGSGALGLPSSFSKPLREAIRLEQSSAGRYNFWGTTLVAFVAATGLVSGSGSLVEALLGIISVFFVCVGLLAYLEGRRPAVTGPPALPVREQPVPIAPPVRRELKSATGGSAKVSSRKPSSKGKKRKRKKRR